MDNSIGLPENVALVSEAMHTAHEEMSKIVSSHKQSLCPHSDYVYAHEDWNSDCKYCQIDACMIRKCKACQKEYR